jgi:hypothetical protein
MNMEEYKLPYKLSEDIQKILKEWPEHSREAEQELRSGNYRGIDVNDDGTISPSLEILLDLDDSLHPIEKAEILEGYHRIK